MTEPQKNIGERLAWDSEFFGFHIGRILPRTLTLEQAREGAAWADASGCRCTYWLADADAGESFVAAQRNGFGFVDLRLDLEARPNALTRTDDRLRPAEEPDHDALCELARSAHRDTRFFKDPRFSPAKSAELYAAWMSRDLAQHHVFVGSAEPGGRPASYITCERTGDDAGRIGLLAVSPHAAGRGLGQALVRAALAWFASHGMHRVRVATQASNVAAQRTYQACGFRTAEAAAWFHRWSS